MINKQPIILFLFFFISTLSNGQSIYTITEQNETQRIGKQFQFMLDSTNALSFESIVTSNQFKPAAKEVPSFNTSSTVWGKMQLTCYTAQDFYLLIDPPSLRSFSFFQKKGNGNWEEIKEGNIVKSEFKSIAISHFFFKLNLSPKDTTTIILKIQEINPVNVDIQVGNSKSFFVPFHRTDVYNGICVGIILMMLIYNCFLLVSQREKEYLWYVLYLISTLLILPISLLGYSFHFPILFINLYELTTSVYAAAPVIFLLLFVMELFKGILPRWLIILNYIFICFSILSAMLGLMGYQAISTQIVLIENSMLIIPCILAGVFAAYKKHSSAIYYLIGYSVFLAGFTFLVLGFLGVIPMNLMEALKVHTAGTSFECVMLSFALGNKLKVSQREKEKAQKEALQQAQKNERLILEQNTLLEQKVNERTAQLSIANQELHAQKEVVEEQQKELKDSIHYARRIQQALLASDNLLNTHLSSPLGGGVNGGGGYFIFFQPKDIVSGDFYWATQAHGKFYLAIADSTGHGVPGAFMSLLNISFLNEAINEKQIQQPAEILNHVRKRLINALKDDGSEEGGKDGMDCILLAFDFSPLSLGEGQGVRLEFACANNSLLLVRNAEPQFFNADKMAVGRSPRQDDPFTNQSIELQKGDAIYAYTDGYADQFGGIKGKKFKYKQLEELILNSNGLPCAERKKLLHSTIESWKGNLEQVDDILVAGITID